MDYLQCQLSTQDAGDPRCSVPRRCWGSQGPRPPGMPAGQRVCLAHRVSQSPGQSMESAQGGGTGRLKGVVTTSGALIGSTLGKVQLWGGVPFNTAQGGTWLSI